ncbi:anthranilate synthase component I family protein [Peribacillus saganii]|uniref:Anthranilate synthase component I family protein n=1 Tax=Peribacillus saganii TaxID=2303992 RepID=A0A372LL27_9BACI|nr:anthranilate synthase component I family protein [Peribacillus saganii]RFU66900.1 anthranilate synthase component I family protein [Peribacillus saganii]
MAQRRLFARKIPFAPIDLFNTYKSLSANLPNHILLESGRGGRYSFIGLNPAATLEGKNGVLQILYRDGMKEILEGDPLLSMKKWMAARKIDKQEGYPDFQGGAIGFLSYDYIRYIEDIPAISEDDLQTPDLYFLIFDEAAVFDHQEEVLWLIYTGEDEATAEKSLFEMEEQWKLKADKLDKNETNTAAWKTAENLSVSMEAEQFQNAAERVRDYIAQGDVFQVNLSVRQSKKLFVPAMEVYECLREINPSPYMAYIQTPGFQVVSGSPELLIKKQDNLISTRPIAGTRSRGKTREEDERLANELIQNEKERAEHVMLVDLERNDLGKVSKFGSVQVNEFMTIEKYSHVMHIVSNVQGELEESEDAYSAVRAVFPGGTITGAPKVRTMEIIEELEPVRRGLYTGSIGWISDSGDMELNIVIRTMVVQDGVGHVQAGAGVVIDSNPRYEYKEALKKAAAMWKAKEEAESRHENKGVTS